MPTVAAVARCHDLGPGLAPGGDHAVDRSGREAWPVCEDDDGGADLRSERFEAAAKRRAGPALPVVALDDASVRLECVRAGDHDDLVDAARANALEHERQEQALLRCTEPACGAGRQHDSRDHQPPDEISMDSTTTVVVGCSVAGSPSFPMRATTSRPEVTCPITA